MTFHKLFTSRIYNSFEQLESEIAKLDSTYEKGIIFEQFVKAYLTLNAQLYQVKEVFLFSEIPYKLKKQLKLEKKDYGVDGIVVFNSDKIATFQVKFRSKRESVSYRELSTFLSESFKSDYKYVIANTYELTEVTKKHELIQILLDTLERLDPLFFENLYNFCNSKKLVVKKYNPLPHQQRAISNIIAGLNKYERGKYISACGTGKTLTVLWVIEKMQYKNILFLVPSLALIKQTLEAWSNQTNKGFNYICICSDNTVSREVDLDEEDIRVNEIGVPVTTNEFEITKFLKKSSVLPKIVFSTYQSIDVIIGAINPKISHFMFDIIIFDEAHRTVGIKDGSLFNKAVQQNNIRSSKRLFMTATEKILTPRIKKQLGRYNEIVFSMDDEEKYGHTFEKLDFGEAISNGIISDYKIIIAAIRDKEGFELIKNNTNVKITDDDKDEHYTTAQNLFRQYLLIKCIKEFQLRKIITFHSNIKNSKNFINDSKNGLKLDSLISQELNININDIFVEHIDGTMSTGLRTKIFDEFKSSHIAVVSNARCLTEGVYVPIIDSVYFVNPKNSLIDIVQAVGRALRKDIVGKKTAYIIVPVVLPDFGVDSFELNEERFESLFYIIQALRDQDNRLAEYIDKINLHLGKGGHITNFSKDTFNPLMIFVYKQIDINNFWHSIALRIAERNANPTSYFKTGITYKKKELTSGYVRKFKTIGDYQILGYKSIVNKTIQKFKNVNQVVHKNDLFIDHNNYSHTFRLGLLKEHENKCRLSQFGKNLYLSKKPFEEIFKRVMLSRDEIEFYPYILTLKILMQVKQIDFLQFLYGIYITPDKSKSSISNTVNRINQLKEFKYKLLVANEKNRKEILVELNQRFGVSFTEPDLLMKTTAGNQFKYLAGHLSLFKEIINYNSKEKVISLVDLKKLKK